MSANQCPSCGSGVCVCLYRAETADNEEIHIKYHCTACDKSFVVVYRYVRTEDEDGNEVAE